MKAITLFISGLLVGYLFAPRRVPGLDVFFETEEMATPSIFRRTIRVHYRPCSPVSKGVAPASA